tara:strand:- start:1023 stop:1427 length:405 start_codon:yes stop_codon:yes gene_type:complete
MSKFRVVYKGDLSTEIEHLDSGSKIITDAPKDNQGLGQTFSPTDLVASSLASCMLTIIAIANRTHSLNIEAMDANVEKIMSSNSPRKISQINVKISIKGVFDDKSKLIIERSAKNCPVHHSLDVGVDLIINYSK